MSENNRIPRKFYKLYITMLIETSAAAPGDRATVYRDEYNELIMETENGKKYRVFISMLRNPEVVRIDRIQEADPATEEQRNKERAFLSDYIIETRDSSKIEKLITSTSNDPDLFWEDARRIAGKLSDHAQSRYYILAEALYKIRFLGAQEAPTAPAADEAIQTPTEETKAPQSATETATEPAEEITAAPREILKKYVFRTYTDWTVYAGRLSEEVITAGSDEEAQQIAIERAAGRAFTCNRMEEGQTARELYGDDSEQITTDAETRATITDGETPAEAAEALQEAEKAPYIPTQEATTSAAGDADRETPTAEAGQPQRATQRATTSPAEAPTSPAETHGRTEASNTPPPPAEARRTDAERHGEPPARTDRRSAPGNKASPTIVFSEKVNKRDPQQEKSTFKNPYMFTVKFLARFFTEPITRYPVGG